MVTICKVGQLIMKQTSWILVVVTMAAMVAEELGAGLVAEEVEGVEEVGEEAEVGEVQHQQGARLHLVEDAVVEVVDRLRHHHRPQMTTTTISVSNSLNHGLYAA